LASWCAVMSPLMVMGPPVMVRLTLLVAILALLSALCVGEWLQGRRRGPP
jgi:hypothetical protein